MGPFQAELKCFPWWIEQLPSDTLTLGNSLLAASWSLFLPNISFFSCKNDSKQPNQIGAVWLVFKEAFGKLLWSCHLSLPQNPGDVGRENCSVLPQPVSRRFSYLLFHTRSEGPCGILLGTQASSTRKIGELLFNRKLYASSFHFPLNKRDFFNSFYFFLIIYFFIVCATTWHVGS